MESTLSKEIIASVASLGALVKESDSYKAMMLTVDEYEHSEELNALIAEYNTQQNILADNFSKGENADEGFAESVQQRINQLYEEIVSHPVYSAYVNAKADFDAMINDIYGELQYQITGQYPCTHDCSSCHSDCSSKK